MELQTIKTAAECDQVIAALEQRKKDCSRAGEFEIKSEYCTDSDADREPYFLPESEALPMIREELVQGGAGQGVMQMSWDSLMRVGGEEADGWFCFDVTREGCHESYLYARLVKA